MKLYWFEPKGKGYIFGVMASDEADAILSVQQHMAAKEGCWDRGVHFNQALHAPGFITDYYVVREVSDGEVVDHPGYGSGCCG